MSEKKREGDGSNFKEEENMEGEVDMVGIMSIMIEKERKRDEGKKIIFR